MTKAELLQRLAELYSVAELQALVGLAESRRPKEQTDWTREWTRCPKCGHEGFVLPDFGVKLVRGKPRKQSWCGWCRAGTNYRALPRKNVSR